MNRLSRLLVATIIVFMAAQNLLPAATECPVTEFRRDLQELVDNLATAGLLPQFNAEQEADFLLKLLRELSIPAVITNLAKAEETAAANESGELLDLASNEGIFYLRLSNFHLPESRQTARLHDDFINQKGRGLVIDLRQVKGFSLEAETVLLNFLRELSVPMLVLIDSATAGTPESMIRKLQDAREVLTLGTASLGIGGAGQEIKLSSGLSLRVPQLENGQLPSPLQPDVELSQDIAPFRIAETIANPAMDPWCQHARDTLKLILTLAAKEAP